MVGVHPPLPHSCAAGRVSPHPVLWLPRQLSPHPETRTLPRATRDGAAAPTPDPPADYRDRFKALTGRSLRECPHCHAGIMVVMNSIARTRICQLVPDTS